MPCLTENYDVAVVGAGHAGCEAALASARLGLETLHLSQSYRLSHTTAPVLFLTCSRSNLPPSDNAK